MYFNVRYLNTTTHTKKFSLYIYNYILRSDSTAVYFNSYRNFYYTLITPYTGKVSNMVGTSTNENLGINTKLINYL